jgi:hypothetical protein
MTQFQLVQENLRYATVSVFYAALLFPCIVSFFWPWWLEWMGRNLVTFDVGFLVVAFPAWLHITFGIQVSRSLAFGYIQVIGLYFVLANIIWRLGLIYTIQRRGSKKGKS